MIRLYRLVLSAAIASLLAAQTGTPPPKTAPKDEWHEYVYPTDGFAFTVPVAPQPHKDGQLKDGTAYRVQLPRLTVSLHVGNYPQGCEDVFKEYLGYARRSVGDAGRARIDRAGRIFRTDPSTIREFNYGGHAAVEYEQEITIEGTSTMDYELFINVDKRLFVLTATWDHGARPPELTRVIRSFRLLTADSAVLRMDGRNP
jgi:hypothetical protein